MPKSCMSRADTTLPLGIVPEAAGSSNRAIAERILSKRLLICPPVLAAENSPPIWFSDALGGLQQKSNARAVTSEHQQQSTKSRSPAAEQWKLAQHLQRDQQAFSQDQQ